MKNSLKRVFALLLVLVMVGSMLPVPHAHAATAPEAEAYEPSAADYAAADAVFAQIDEMEDAPAKKSATEKELADEAAALVMASDNYVEGSLERNGNSFTWWTDEGIRCVYSPRMREIESNMVAPENPIADGAYNEPVAQKGGWPSSNQVYLIAPYYGYDDSFTDQYKNEATSIASAIGDTDGYTLYSGKAATIDTVAEAMSNGAVVIFDSHGNTDYENGYDYVTGANYSYLCMKSTTGLTQEDYNDGALYYSDGIWITGASIANHMTKNSPAGILWMAICLGMATDTFAVPMREKGVEVVYGYSQSVTFAGDYLYEETFWDNMIAGKNVATSISAMKSKWGNWDWSTQIATANGYTDGYSTISAARSDYAAFPVVVSDEDTHPGQRSGNSSYGADSLQTVNSTYTLFSQYEVTAVSNNASYGSVSVNGSTITATPATGYFAQSATVTSGTATVTQNGNTFSVSAQSDCTVQINFAAKTPVTVNFSGATVAAQSGYAGDTMSLPTSVEAPEGYKFLGWTTTALTSDTTDKPAYYTDSFVPSGSVTLYALYSYVEGSSGGTGEYTLVTDASALTVGAQILIAENSKAFVAGDISSQYMTNIAATFSSDKETVELPDGAVVLTLGGSEGAWTLADPNGKLLGATAVKKLAWDSGTTTWSISVADGAATIQNGTSTYGRFLYNSSSPRFTTYTSSSSSSMILPQIYMLDGSGGTTYYTSTPIQCDHSSTVDVAAVDPTCTETGFTAGVKCTLCDRIISGYEVVEALGHSWDEGSVATAPTCTATGVMSYNCTRCGETKTEDIPANGHSLDEGTVTTAATCTTAGVMTYTCTVCGNTSTETIPATGHSFAEGVCSVCGEAEPQVSSTKFYIAAARDGGNYFYMTSDLGTASNERYQAVDSGLTALPESITDPQDGYVFVLEENTDGTYSIYVDGMEGDNYLGWTSGNSGTLVAQSNAIKATMDQNEDGTVSLHFAASDAERYLSLNKTSGNNYFAWYKMTQVYNLYLIPLGVADEEPTEPEVSEPEVSEPEASEPEVTEPEASGDRFYIATVRSSGNYFYMTSDLGTASTKRYQAVDSGLTALPESIADPQSGYVFVIVDNGDGTYSICAEGVEGNNYLGWTSGNSGTLVAESSALKLTKDTNDDGTVSFHFAGDAERYLALNGTSGNNYFAWYKSGQKQNLTLIPVGGSVETPTEPEVTEPEVSEPESSEPEVSEPESSEPEVSEPEVSEPAGTVTSLQYVFSDYTAGTQYAQGENHTLDDVITLTINGAHLNGQIRLYAGSNAVFTSAKEIDSIIVKAGYKAGTLNVYSSADGSTWNLVSAQATTTTYTNYSFDMPEGTMYVKLESVGAQIRVSEMTINVLESGTTEPEVTEPESTEPEVSEPESSEPEVSEPEVSEPEETQPVAGAEVTIDFSTTDQRVSLTTESQVWANGGATLTNNKASSTSNVADYSNPVRFYKSSEIIIAFPGMNKIEVNCNSAEYATALVNSISDSNAAVTQNGQVVTIEFTNAVDQISFTASAQIRVNDLTVYREETCQHEYTSVVTAPTCTEAGYTTYTCSVCGDSYTADEVEALGHNYVLEGDTYTCSVCGDSYERYFVSFSVPEGVDSVADIECVSGSITLPTANAPEGYTFAGWATGVVDNSAEKPEILAAGSAYETDAAVTLYAVYTYKVESENSDYYVKVTEAPADWSGEYLIVYEADETVGYVYNGSLDSQDTLSKANNYVELEIADGAISAEAGDPYKFIISASGDAYTIQSLSGFYIGRTASTNGLNASTDTVYTNTLSLDSFGHANIVSEAGTYLKFNSSGLMFRYYGTGQQNIELYTKPTATVYYTTVITEETVSVESWNITLSDSIGLNFVMAGLAEGDEVSFFLGEEQLAATVDESGKYSITLAAAQMTDEITVKVNGKALEGTYSVRAYADVILADETKADCHALVKEMLNYGAASQTFFGHTGTLANEGITVEAAAVPTEGGDVSVSGSVDGITFYGASLLHKDKIAVRFYFQADSIEGLNFTVNGETCEAVSKDDKFYVEVAGINPQDLNDDIVVMVNEELSVSYSPMDYIIRMYNKAESSAELKALVQALYGYYATAEAYTAE